MTREEFIALLKRHDWGFQYSDDPVIYRAGAATWSQISNAVKVNPEFKQVFEDYVNKKEVA